MPSFCQVSDKTPPSISGFYLNFPKKEALTSSKRYPFKKPRAKNKCAEVLPVASSDYSRFYSTAQKSVVTPRSFKSRWLNELVEVGSIKRFARKAKTTGYVGMAGGLRFK